MESNIKNGLSGIFKILQAGTLGKTQVINVSANAREYNNELLSQVNALLCTASFAFGKKVDKETVTTFEKEYRYGVLVREYVDGAILKLFLRNAPIEKYFEINVYGSNAELFYDSHKNQITIYEQIPDTEGITTSVNDKSALQIYDEEFWVRLLEKSIIEENVIIAKNFLERNND